MPPDSNRSPELRFLGGFDIRVGGHSVAGFSYNKMRALLAYLAMEQQEHRREALAGLLWSDCDPVTGRGNLRRTLADVRRVLEASPGVALFETGKHTLRFIPGSYCDVTDFSRRVSGAGNIALGEAERLIALYRGELLAGLALPDCPEFEDWLQARREALHRHALALLEQLIRGYEQAGDHGKALQFALRFAELEPWSEVAHRQVMRLYAMQDMKSAALVQYETCRRLLKDGMGVLPGEETRQLAEGIRNGDWRAAAPAVARITEAPIERRQVTALYCELTQPGINDPDEALDALHAPQVRCMELIRQFYGHIVQTHGGGLLAYFGYPRASEHAARHAVQAALAIVRAAVDGTERRVGIHTGMMITGGESATPDATGSTSRLAIQLRQYAASDDVAISSETRDITAGFFECAPLGSQLMPGLSRPVEIFRVLGASGAQTRVDAAVRLTPLAGRQAEIGTLMELWQQAARGQRKIALIQADAGIGKTRLLHTIKERLSGTAHAVREMRCFPEASQSPFHPLIAMLEATLGIVQRDAPEERFCKLASYLDIHFPDKARDALPLLARLLSVSADGQHPSPGLPPRKLKEQTLAILLDLLSALSAQQPVLLIVEDLHWADPSTLELLTLLVAQTRAEPVLALFTARPAFANPWQHILDRVLPLSALADDEVRAMLASMETGLPAAAIHCIVERADGVPLFVEEIANVVSADARLGIPATLLDLLAARIDNVGEAKRTAQLAATLGREFDPDLLRRISAETPAVLAQHLQTLQEAGLLLPTDAATRQFKHALIQETAYQSQTRAKRQAAHQRIAQVLQADYADTVIAQPELLAQHLANAGETRPAIDYWIIVGQRAAQRVANLEALGHFKSALQLLATLPAGLDRDKLEFSLLVQLSPVLHAAEGYGSQDASQTNARIAVLSDLVGDSPKTFPAQWAVSISTIATIGPRGMPAVADKLLQLAQDDPVRQLAARHIGANACFWLGEFEASHSHYERSVALRRSAQRQEMLAQYGTDLSVFNASHGMCALYFLGFPEQAQNLCTQTIRRARKTGHAHTLAQALSFGAALQRWLNKPEAALQLSAEAIAIAREQDFLLWLASGQISHGWALVMRGETTAGLAELNACVAGMRAATGGIPVISMAALIDAYIHLGRHGGALTLIEETLADAARTGDEHYLAELLRLQGECLLQLSPHDTAQAEALFGQALALSRKQQAKTCELRIAMSLARLWQQQGKRKQAQRLLADIYASFTEGFSTHDLHQAAALLHSLG